MDNSISIASSAMLVELNISTWTARKLDKKVSAEVDLAKGTKTSAVNVNKNLLAGTGFLDTITKYAANARAWHISQTLPWSDNGLRLLPVSNFITYKEQLNTLETNFNALVEKFIVAYPNLVSAAAFQLGALFNRDEYPSREHITSKFGFRYSLAPLPTSGDFRIDIAEDGLNELKNHYEGVLETRVNGAMQDAWDRLHDVLSRMSERLTPDIDENGDEKRKIFRDSLVENAIEVCGLLKHFNITNDVRLEEMRRQLEDAMRGVDASSLRESDVLRQQTKRKVDDLLGKFAI